MNRPTTVRNYSDRGRPSQVFASDAFLFSCRDGVYACAVPTYIQGVMEGRSVALDRRIDEINKMAAGEAISRSFKTMFLSFYDQKTPSWDSELKEIDL